MEDILQTNPDVDAVFCANDQMALGAIQAIAAHKKTDQIKLIGFDGALEATQHILAGDMYATIAQDPYGMAKVGVEQALAKLEDKERQAQREHRREADHARERARLLRRGARQARRHGPRARSLSHERGDRRRARVEAEREVLVVGRVSSSKMPDATARGRDGKRRGRTGGIDARSASSGTEKRRRAAQNT